jgi:PKD repeat protein
MKKEMFKTGSIIGIVIITFFVLTIPVMAESSIEKPSSQLTLNILNETTTVAYWYIHCPGEYAAYLPSEREKLEKNIGDLEKGMEQLFLQDVQNIKITYEHETVLITFDLKGDYTSGFVTGKCQYLPELVRYAPIGLNVLKVVLPEDRTISIVNPGPNGIEGNELTFYNYNWIYPLEIFYYAENDYFNKGVTAIIGEEWQIPQLEVRSVEYIKVFDYETNARSKFAIPYDWVGTCDDTPPGTTKSASEIANDYEPWLYNRVDQCPDAVYYRVVEGSDPYAGFDAYLIQYFVYWRCQDCSPAWHEYDYEPIFVWVRNIGERPYRVAYDHWGGLLDWHVHEIHRTDLWSSSPEGEYPLPSDVYTQHKAYYPFGRSEYAQDGLDDIYIWNISTSLHDNWDGNHVKLGVATCYHTFDTDMSGSYCGNYLLSPLYDDQLVTWYRNEIDDDGPCDVCDCDWWESWSVMPFKYDISDPFYGVFWEDCYGEDYEFPTLSETIDSAVASDGTLTVDVSVLYDNTGAGGSSGNDLRGLWKDRFIASVGSYSIGNPDSLNEYSAGHYTLEFDVSGISQGTYILGLFVWDNLNHNYDIDYENVIIQNSPPYKPSNPSPTDGATDVDINADLSWSGGDLNGDLVTYAVYFGTDPTPTTLVSDQTGTTYNPGTLDYSTHYYWKIIAEDEHGATNEGDVWDFTTEEEPNDPPTASFTYSPPNPTDLDTIQFTDTSTDSDGSIESWYWEFGDENTSTEQNPAYQYADDETYTVNLTVTDDDGATNTTIKDIIVSAASDTTPPLLNITSPAPNTSTHSPTITITGTASDASGIASVRVNGLLASGAIDWSTWSAEVALAESENVIIIIATDGAELTTTAAVTVHYEPIRGDLNHDGILTPADAAIALRIAATGTYYPAADVSGDDRVTSLDALMILQAAAGRIEV